MRPPRLASLLVLLVACTSKSTEAKSPDTAAPGGPKETAPVPGQWTANIEDNGTWRLSFKGVPVLQFKYVFWNADWAWAGYQVEPISQSIEAGRFRIRVPKMGLDGTVTIESEEQKLVTRFDLNVDAPRVVTGGGLEFKALFKEDLFAGRAGEPELREGSSHGFDVQTGAGDVHLDVEGGDPRVYFERGRKSQIRAFFMHDDVEAGPREVTMTLRVPASFKMTPSLAQSFGPSKEDGWFTDSINATAAPVDLKHLAPKRTKNGLLPRVLTKDDAFVLQDGTPIRFLGTNITAYALFRQDKKAVERQVARMAAMGINLVRLHHHDSTWVDPNVFGSGAKTTRDVKVDALGRIDWWIKTLNEHGIYVWLDLHVGRGFKPADDIEAYDEIADNKGQAKGMSFVNPSIEARMLEFAEQYLTRKNVHTKRSIAQDPGILAVLVTNENDLVHHFGNNFLANKNNPKHRKMFLKRAEPIIQAQSLPRGAALQTWVPGPSKRLLSELEIDFFRRHEARLEAWGLKALVARGNVWGGTPAYVLPSLAGGDIIDVHAYDEAGALQKNPHFEPNFVQWIGAFQVLGKPLSVSEWNVPWPAEDRFVYPLYVAAIASLQGWDAPMLYGWTQGPVTAPKRPDPWSTFADPAIAATMPAASLLFREQHVTPSPNLHVVQLDEAQVYDARTSPETSRTLRTLVERSRLALRLPGSELPVPTGAKLVRDLDRDFIPNNGTVVESDTGQLRRDWARGRFIIDSPKSQAVLGGLDGETIELSSVSVSSENRRAAIVFTAMDQKAIERSERILVTMVARATDQDGELPYRAEPVRAKFTIKHDGPLRMLALDPSGGPMKLIEAEPSEGPGEQAPGTQTFSIDGTLSTHWFVLMPDPSA